MDNDYLFKIAVLGNIAVGKSSIIQRFTDDTFSNLYKVSLGVDLKFKTLELNTNIVKLQIWDTAGHQKFHALSSSYYKNINGIILVFDLLDKKSFIDLEQYWYKEIYNHVQQGVTIILLGNKKDLKQQIMVSQDQLQAYSKYKNIKIYLVSAKTGQGVNQAILELVKQLMNRNKSIYQSQKNKKLQRKNQQKTNAQKYCRC